MKIYKAINSEIRSNLNKYSKIYKYATKKRILSKLQFFALRTQQVGLLVFHIEIKKKKMGIKCRKKTSYNENVGLDRA